MSNELYLKADKEKGFLKKCENFGEHENKVKEK